jgi:hypothetical protein
LTVAFFDRSVHPFNLPIDPRMAGPRQPVPDPVGLSDPVEADWPGMDGVAVAVLLCALDVIVGQYGMDLLGHDFGHVLPELTGSFSVSFFEEVTTVTLEVWSLSTKR